MEGHQGLCIVNTAAELCTYIPTNTNDDVLITIPVVIQSIHNSRVFSRDIVSATKIIVVHGFIHEISGIGPVSLGAIEE